MAIRMNDSAPAAHDGTLRLPDGRAFGYQIAGAVTGTPVLMLHGTPGSRFKFATTDAPARARPRT
jgi:pimeloyl-ACP methyl ester carboxylesterase